MKPIVFSRVSDMRYYRGITDKDKPYNGGSYVLETGYAHECNNFNPIVFDNECTEYCLGFCQLPGYSKYDKDIELHIEKIPGCKSMKDAEKIEDAIVVFCSSAWGSNSMRVVGFYKHATVYRMQRYCTIGDELDQYYNFLAKREDCVLLPYTERHSKSKWYVPSSGKNKSTFGFGRSNISFIGNSNNEEEITYVNRMIQSVESYDGENWMDKEVN